MIVFDLKCGADHVFEAWFASGAAYGEQRERGQVVCPVCGDRAIEKAAMAPALARASEPVPTERAKAVLQVLAAAQRRMLDRSRWVGRDFAREARAMHDGERAVETIHGQATRDEAKALIDDGVKVAPLPLPVVPPEALN